MKIKIKNDNFIFIKLRLPYCLQTLGTEISDEHTNIVHGNNSDSVSTVFGYSKYHT